MNFGAWVFFIVFGIGLIWAVKNKRITKLDMSLFIAIVLVYYLIAYLFDNEMLSPFIFKEDSFTISFVGFILLIGTFLLVRYIINKFKKK
ncbi:hypothetical protein BABA_13407 [Neobacillus bataviensis LMG 21833]|uniref:Uncharacterized protein n=1 Tax=Neobacillus bataviensis LMG 21833 TaxID=1117379 RepID=K6DFG9_9BACI|nr:hypothetical protein [Neobacillus bataviensis]EKN67034.1 hypothetical protein BABA_13407 [Neobacillus bataviensis LMG 21833]